MSAKIDRPLDLTREITRLTAEVEQLKQDNDAMYRAGASDGYACAGIEVRAKWQAVVDAARKWQRSPVNRRDEADLHDTLRALDGEPSAESEGGLTGAASDRGEPVISKSVLRRLEHQKKKKEPCPTCGGCGYLPTDTPHTDQTCQACCGTGRKP